MQQLAMSCQTGPQQQTCSRGFGAVGIGAGKILKVEGHSGGSNYFGAKRRKKFFGAPHIFSCAHPVFDGIRGTTIKVKQF